MAAWSKRVRRWGRRWAILLFLTGTLFSAVGSFWLFQNEREHLRQVTLLQLSQFRSAVDSQLKNHSQPLEHMAQRWSAGGGTSEAVWRQDAAAYVRYLPAIETVAYLDRDFNIHWIMTDQQASYQQDLNLFLSPQATADLARDTTPSIRSTQSPDGGNQLILRYPLMANGQPDGFMLAVLDPGVILEQVGLYLVGVNINLSVSQNGQVIYRLVSAPDDRWLDYQQTNTLSFYDVSWHFRGWPSNQTASQVFSVLPGLILLGGIALSALASWLMREMHIARLRARLLHRLAKRLQGQNRRRREAERRFREVIDSAPFAILLTGRDQRIQLANEIACSTFGYQTTELIGQPIDLLIPLPLRTAFKQQRDWYFQDNPTAVSTPLQYRGLRKDGSEFPMELMIRPASINNQMLLLTSMIDISERQKTQHRIQRLNEELQEINQRLQSENEFRRQAEAELRRVNDVLIHQASHDALTNLINRQEFNNRLARAIQRAQDNHLYALLFLDLDNFKTVNDTCGHNAGDRLLQSISAMFSEHMRSRDCLARLGGDEFGILLENCTIEDAKEVATKILHSMHNYHFVCGGHHIPVGVSIGIAPVSKDFTHQEEVLKAADMACYLAKNNGRNRYEIFLPEQRQRLEQERDRSLTGLISKSLLTDNLVLFEQPILPLKDAGSPHIELTVSLRDEQGNLRPASSFMLTAERHQLSPDIDRWVVMHALELLPSLNEAQDPDFRLFLNLSSNSIADADFLRFLERALGTRPQLAQQVAFDLKESTVTTNLSLVRQFMERFSQLGCEFAIDSFGSTLAMSGYLRSLPVQYLKIDEMYVRNLRQDGLEHVLVSAIVEAGHTLGLRVMAKQVEHPDTVALLRKLGVDYVGGHVTGRPQPILETSP